MIQLYNINHGDWCPEVRSRSTSRYEHIYTYPNSEYWDGFEDTHIDISNAIIILQRHDIRYLLETDNRSPIMRSRSRFLIAYWYRYVTLLNVG